jgi:hypothetical protein
MKHRSNEKPRITRDHQSTGKTTRRANNRDSSLSKALSGSEVPGIYQLINDPPSQKNHSRNDTVRYGCDEYLA